MKRSKCAIALIAAVSVLAFAGAGLAANPAQADFDACNKEAQAKGGSPAASPGTSGAPSATPSTSGGASGTPSGGAAAGAGTSGTTGGTVSGGASTSADLQGMASAGQTDPAYQQAYRDCMKRRGF